MKELIIKEPIKPFMTKDDVKKFLNALNENIRDQALKTVPKEATILDVYAAESDFVIEHYLPETFWERFYKIPSLQKERIQKIDAMRQRMKPNGLTIDQVMALLPDL